MDDRRRQSVPVAAADVDPHVARRAGELVDAQQPPAGPILSRRQLAHVHPAGVGFRFEVQIGMALDGHHRRLVDDVFKQRQRQLEVRLVLAGQRLLEADG